MIQENCRMSRVRIAIDASPRFKVLLADADLSQAEFARRVSTSENTVSKWANGKTKVPGAVMAYLTLLVRVKGALD